MKYSGRTEKYNCNIITSELSHLISREILIRLDATDISLQKKAQISDGSNAYIFIIILEDCYFHYRNSLLKNDSFLGSKKKPINEMSGRRR